MNKSVFDPLPLLSAVKAGEDGAFSELVSVYEPLLSAACRRVTEADPAVLLTEAEQEARVALYRAALAYREENREVSFGLFARICVSNALTSHFLRRHREPSCSLEELHEGGDWQPVDDSPTPDETLISDEAAAGIWSMIRSVLSEKEYSVFSMYSQGMTTAEISSALDEPLKSVRNALNRARQKLRTRF